MPTPLEIRAAAYIARLPHAIAGNGGSRVTFAAACRLVEFGLSFESAVKLLSAWNETHCQPKWKPAELAHKLADAFKRTSVKPEFATAARASVPYRTPIARPSQSSVTPPPQKQNAAAVPPTDADRLAIRIRGLLETKPAAKAQNGLAGALQEFRMSYRWHDTNRKAGILATQRGISLMGVMNAFSAGLLRFDNHLSHDAWLVLDRSERVASARRLDGKPWNQGTAGECKAMMLAGSQAKWPIGIREAQSKPVILLCEGAPDLLAAFHYLCILRNHQDFAPVAMLSAACPIHTDALRLFTGKRVRILAHNDNSGMHAAARWTEQLSHRAKCDTFLFQRFGVNDLNDYARANISGEHILNITI